tara:strand:+ start:259 stop:468 length:210 start_codon:yes stop_codon:yes gene_type:complete
VTGIISVEIVPKPSTYVLLAGIIAFTFIAKRNVPKLNLTLHAQLKISRAIAYRGFFMVSYFLNRKKFLT